MLERRARDETMKRRRQVISALIEYGRECGEAVCWFVCVSSVRYPSEFERFGKIMSRAYGTALGSEEHALFFIVMTNGRLHTQK